MTANMVDAWKEVLAFLKNIWDNSVVTQTVPLYQPNLNTTTPPTSTAPWARVNLVFDESYQSALGDTVKRYTLPGYLSVQIFIPVGTTVVTALSIAQVVIEGLRGQRTASGVLFRDTRTEEISKSISGNWYQYNVLIFVEVDDIQ